MGCFHSNDHLEKDPEPTGLKPYSRRSCTDIIFLAAFIASFVGLAILLGKANTAGGNPQRIIRGVDYLGRICGSDPAVANLPYAAWSYIPTTPTEFTDTAPYRSQLYHIKVCVSSCDVTNQNNTQGTGLVTTYSSTQYLYYCVPNWQDVLQQLSGVTGGIDVQANLTGSFQTASMVAAQNMAALMTTWPVILVSAFIATVLSYLYIYTSRVLAGWFVWLTILLLAAGGFMISFALLKDASYTASSTTALTDRATILRGIGYTFVAVTIIFILIVFALRNRIRIAIEIIKEASRSIADIPLLPFFPTLPFLLTLAYFVFWIYTAIYLFSVQTTTYQDVPPITTSPSSSNLTTILTSYANATTVPPITPTNTTTLKYVIYDFDTTYQRSFAYIIFQLLWTIQFLEYFTFVVAAGAIANWYFSVRDTVSGEKVRGTGDYQLRPRPIWSSLLRVLRFHLGTVALCALIIAIIQFIRATIRYVEKHTYNANGGENRLQKTIFCCIQCCLYCLQCCLDKINKNALIWTAMYGSNFLVASFSSFKLIWTNILRAAALNAVSVYVMTLGKLIVALLTAGGCGLYMYNAYTENDISSIVLPILVIFAVAYVVAAMFITVFETTADTVFLCFLIDEQYNGDRGMGMFASPGLLDVIKKHGLDNEQQGKKLLLQQQKRDERLGTHTATMVRGMGSNTSLSPVNNTQYGVNNGNGIAPALSPPPSAVLMNHQYGNHPGGGINVAPARY